MRYSKGIMWLDDCRIPFVDETEKEGVCKSDKEITKDNDLFKGRYEYKRTGGDTKGRFTPNLLVCDDMLNDGVKYNAGNKQGQNYTSKDKNYSVNIGGGIHTENNTYNDKGSNSRYYDLDKWFEKIIDEIQ